MMKKTDYRAGRNCVFLLAVHLVFVAKNRKCIFNDEDIKQLQIIFENICAKFESELIVMSGEKDHVYLFISYPPKVAVSKLVNSLKRLFWKDKLWSPTYLAASDNDADKKVIQSFIEGLDGG